MVQKEDPKEEAKVFITESNKSTNTDRIPATADQFISIVMDLKE